MFIIKPSRQVLRRVAIRARRMQRSLVGRGHRVALSQLSMAVSALLAGSMAYGNPSGGQVVAGSATITNGAPGTQNIFQQSNRAIINWQGFSIAANETVNFVQPSASSVTLNRVLGNDPSAIFGRLNANGSVMLVNPNGIVFGAGSRVDVGGLVASTANIRDKDFMAGRYAFTQASPSTQAAIENHGHISIKDSGLAAMVAPRVRNAGVIEARLGRVALGAANTFTLDFHGDGLLSFGAGAAISEAPGGDGALVINSGEIRAEGGNVLLTARALKGVVDQVINTSGLISATTVSGENGRIVLSGGDAGTVAIGGRIDASAALGGQGGTVVATGEHVAVMGGTLIDASGRNGGGEIALGSTGLTDSANRFANKSQSVTVAAGAELNADATGQGDGGTVTLWSKDQTVFAGNLSARGAGQGGDGGFAEVSSQNNIELTGGVDLRATQGKTGTLLIDPTDLRIVDAASGGSQDGNAGDGNVASGDANQGSGGTLNTVSRGLLESISGSANIVLQATGQITVDAMAGGLISLATTAGHGFTLQSTLSNGIRFVDANTEVRTQGGNITLEALGIGSTLANIGKLSSNGGAVTLRATGDVQLGGAINAGSGAVQVQTTVGSITNAGATAPLVSGNSVTLTAGGGNIGAAGNAISTHTTQLGLEAGGSIHAASDMALASLSVNALHVAPGTHTYNISGTGLNFQLTDGSAVNASQITLSGLNLTLASDRDLTLGDINVGAGTVSARSSGGNLFGTAGSAVTAGSITLSANGSTGNNGAIGSGAQAINTATSALSATSGTGGAYVANTGMLALNTLNTRGSSSITSTGTLTAGNVNAGSATLALGSTGGSVLDDGNSTTRIAAGTLQLSAGGAIGSSGARVSTNASTLSANAALGGIYAATSANSSVLSSITSGNGAIDITTGGSSTLTSLTSSTSSASNSITVAATGTGSMSVGTVNAGSLGDVTLTTTAGSISGNSGLITGNTVTLNAANSGSVSVRTAASHLDVQAGSSSINITQTGSVTLDRISTPSTFVSVTSNSGDITVGGVSTSTSGQVSLTATAGAILDDGNSATRIITGTASLSAGGAIGTATNAVQTKATGLAVTSTGNLYVTNTDATLTNLSVTNRHTAPGVANTLQITSPYLTFDVTDSGTQYSLNRLVGVPLGSLAFSGDQTVQVGQVQAAGSVSLTATQGNLVDDGNLNSRVTSGSTLTLSAAQGSVGSIANPMSANASSLALTTRGDLYITDIADLSTLTITSKHADTSTSYGMAITAPSLKFSVTDSAAGHAVNTLTDTSSLTLNFTSDRDITLGQVDVTNTGSARFTSTAGAIKDDGNKSTRVLANSTTLSGLSVGASGTAHLDVVTGTLAATASAGGVYVEVPMPTGSTNTTSTLTLGTITATGPVAISALEGNLSLGGFMTATNQSVSLTAAQGAILSPSGYSIAIGTGSLTLDAAQAIGSSGSALPVTSSSGATLSAQAGTSMWLSGSGPMTLSSLGAGAGITYTQSSGAITVGHVDATAGGTVAITASTGAIQDDSNGATGIRANQVSLSAAQSSIGSGTAIAVDAPKLLVTANGNINVADSATLDTLSLTRGTGSSGSIAITAGAGQHFTISEDGSAHYLELVDSSTPLAFSFAGQRNVKVGSIDVGNAGSASISSAADLSNDGMPGSSIVAGRVSLTAGTAGSIGATGAGNGFSLEGTTALTLNAGRNFFAASDSALTDLAITSTNTTTAAGTASVFGVSGLGQTFGITDSGTTQSLDFTGTALTNTSFTTRKNIVAGALTATGDVVLTTSGGGANSNISSDSGSGRIAGNRVLLTATSSTSGGGSIGSSGTALRVDTPTVILNGSANVYVSDAQNLAKLDMTLTHGTNTAFGYGVTAGNLNSFNITDGSTQSLGLAVSGAMDFSYSVDRALSVSTVDAGTSTTGTVSLTSRSAPTGTGAQINRSSGSITAGTVTLSATGSNGGVGAGATLSTNTKNLSIATGGNVSVSNSTSLTSLALDARHNTSGSSTHSYSISSTGLTFSISDTLGNNAFQLSNITQTGLDLAVKADRVITASSVNTGAGGKVTLNSASYVQGGSGASAGSPSITTGDLTLNGGSAFGYQGSTPLYTAAGTLSSNLSNTLYLSNAGALTLKTNTVGGSADVASSNNSLLQGSGGLFTTPTLKLSANQSLGSTGALLTDARRLTLVSRGNIDVSNASDLYALTMTSTHGTPGVQNTISVAAPRLALALSDSAGGNQYHLSNLVDSSGLDFTLNTDVDLNLGTVNAQAGRSLALYSTGATTSITNDGSSLLTAGSVTLSAGGSVGAAGGSGTRMQTDALSLTLATGANVYTDNAQDLTSLSLTSSQTAGGTPPVYQVTAPSLAFDVTDNGTTHINNVTDSTGLNFTLNTQRDQAVGVVDVGRSGTVSLTSAGDILGDADSSKRIHAASATLYASNGGAIGSVGNPIRLSAPLVSLSPTGALNVESDTHIDSLSISTTHPTVTYGGTYNIVSVPITGAAYPLFTATDSVTGTALTSLNDPLGLAFTFTSDHAMQVGTLNLGATGTVTLTGTGSGDILGDGDPNTLVQAASLSMTSYGGAVGASGSGNGIDATVNAVSATAQGGAVYLALHGRTSLGNISATGGMGLSNDEGDIALGSINAGGNAVTINNQGGSILSGSINNTTAVSLTASGSIGNTSAIGTSANGGGTTTLTASASAAHGASGSIAISESYNLAASSVTAPAAVTLSSGYGLSVGTITSGAAVTLDSSQGSITGINGSNAITGTRVDLSARYGTGNSIGSSGTRLNVNTPQLVLNTPGSVYVTDSADLNLLTVDRTNYTGTGSSGTLSVIASGLTFSATDSSNTTTLTSLSDGTGLDFNYQGIGSLAVGNLNVGGTGSMLLQAYLSGGDGNINAINGSSLITAGNLTLQAYGAGSNIGTTGTPLGLAVGSLTASAGTGGIVLNQAGSLNLSSVATTGDLKVTASSGDLTLGSLSYGSAKTLNLTASAGSILAGSGTLTGGGANAAITLSAANGIGTDVAPILVNASAGHTVSASVTGTGSLYLSSLGTLNGGLSTAVNNGSTNVTAAGNTLLTSMTSSTDAVGNDIRVTASAGDITVVNVSGGANARANEVQLSANAGRLLATGSTVIEGFEVSLYGATGVGNSTYRVGASGQRVQVESGGGAIYLGASSDTVLSSVESNGGLIDIAASADLLLANAASGGGAINVTGTASNVALIAGNINAGSGSVTMASTGSGGTVQDDGNASTHIIGNTVTLNGAAGIGSASQAVQTSAGSLTLTGGASGTGVFVDDANASGVTLNSVIAQNGAVVINTAGPTVATLVSAASDAAGNNVTLSTSSGDLTVASVSAGPNNGVVTLTSAGSILASGGGTHVTAQGVQLNAGANIGTVTDLVTGAGTPIRINASALNGVTTTGTNAVVSIDNLNTSTWTLGAGAVSMGSGGSAYLRAAGDLNVTAGLSVNGNLLLSSAGLLTLPTAGISTTGALRLIGSTDVVSAGAVRNLQLAGDSVYLRSGAAGGDTTLTTSTGVLDAALSSAGDLTVNNTGTLTSTTLATSDGDITATSSSGMTASSVIAGGSGRTIDLSASSGDLTVGTLNAGAAGTLTLSAATGKLLTSAASLTGSTLNLSSGSGIGSSGAAFDVNGIDVAAQVTGTGSIYLASTPALTTGALTTANGDILVTTAGNLNANGVISAGQSGNVSLTSTGGDVALAQAFVNNGLDTSRSGLSVQGQQITVGAVTTSGAQTYTGNLIVGGALSGSTLSVSGNSTLNANVTTFGVQSYGGAVTLGVDATLAGNGIGFASTLDGAHALTVNAGSGAANFAGAVGGTTRLGALNVASSGATTFAGAVRAATLSTDAAGSLVLNGGTVDTTGTQTYGERAVLGSNTTLAGSTVTLAGGADGSSAGGQALTVAGNLVGNGAIGANQSLASVSVSGNSTLNANITTAGTQTYTGAVTLAGDTTLNGAGISLASTLDGAHALTVYAGSGAANFAGAVGGTTRLGVLNVASSGATTFAGAVRAATLSTDAAGSLVLNGGTVDTTGTQTYGERAVLGSNTTLAGSTVTLAGGADGSSAGGQALTVAGNLVGNGAIGANQSLASVSVSGNSTLNANITTAGTQTYTGAVTLAGDTTLNGAGISLASTLDGAHALTVNSGSGAANFAGAVGGTTRLGVFNVASSGATTFASTVRATTLSTDAAGSLALNGGTVDTTGTQAYGERAVLGSTTTLTGSTVTLAGGADGSSAGGQALTVAGNLVGNGAIGANQSLASVSVSGNSTLNANITTAGTQTYTGAVTLAGDTTLNGAGISLASTLDGAHALTVNAGSGAANFAGAVGGTTRLGALNVASSGATTFAGAVRAATLSTDAAGSLALNGGTVDTTGTQAYGERAVLGSTTTLTGSTVTLAGGADGSSAGGQALTVAGNLVGNGAIGANQSLASVTVSGNSTLNANVTTFGVQSYGGAVTLGVDATLAGNGIGFASTLDGAHALTVNAGSGAANFAGAVGGTTRLGALNVASSGATTFAGAVRAATLSTDAAGSLVLNGGTVDTTGTQAYGERAVLGSTTTLTGSTVTLAGGADGSSAGGQALTVAGNLVGNGAIGANQSLASVSVSGNSTLNANITTAGTQTYTGAVTLAGDTTLDGAGISLASTLDGAHALTVNAGSGAANFAGAVGGTTRLGVLNVASSGATTFAGAVRAATLSTDAAGSLALNGGTVDTTGTQAYGERAVLGSTTTLTGSTVTLAGGADGSSAGGQALTVAGNFVGNGAIGANQSLASVSVSGNSTLNANITTAGTQTYTGAVTLAGDTTLNGAGISLASTLDGAHALTVNAGSGAANFAGAVGGTTRLGVLNVASSGATTFASTVRAATLSTDAAGSLALNGGTVDTTGTQTYGEHAVLGANTTLSGTTVSLASGVDAASAGSQGLTIVANAVLGDVGVNQALKALSVSGTTLLGAGGPAPAPLSIGGMPSLGAATLLGGATVNTTGSQTYSGAFTAGGDATLSSSGGSLVFGSAVDGPQGKTLALYTDAGDVDVAGALRVGNLIQTVGGMSRFRNTVTAESDIQLSARSFIFDNAVTANKGAISLANSDSAGTVNFAAGANVQAATGFSQTGGAVVYLPAQLRVTQGPISLEASARLPGGQARIETDGNITLTGLIGTDSALTMNGGWGGKLVVGLNDAEADHKLNVRSLAVQTTASAMMYGAIGGQGGAQAASRVNSRLVNAPYFINDTPWGPIDTIATVTATTTPKNVVPSRLLTSELFSRKFTAAGIAPDALSVYADPEVLSMPSSSSQPKPLE
ncbi:filamentous hemagglutinin N-terminal domain-containing protein [Niveibacterium terrae]|uniref:filamentous hemagglutinin N-terminal domain-containing protein n=1 Tax=Niveibacterium terrae TaxID=3373598 RepID=UPI003A8C8FF3